MLLMHCLCISRFSGGASEPQQREQNAKKDFLKTDPVPVSVGRGERSRKALQKIQSNAEKYETLREYVRICLRKYENKHENNKWCDIYEKMLVRQKGSLRQSVADTQWPRSIIPQNPYFTLSSVILHSVQLSHKAIYMHFVHLAATPTTPCVCLWVKLYNRVYHVILHGHCMQYGSSIVGAV